MPDYVNLHSLSRRLSLMVIVGGGERRPIEIAEAAVRGGATAIQLRWKQATTRELIDLGREMRTATDRAGALLVINDRIDVAMVIGADGAHLGDDDLPLEVARRSVPAGFLVGKSVDTLDDARTAEALGADYVGLGPIFPTLSKSDTGSVIGVDGINAFAAMLRIPIVAIGGIDARSALAVIGAGASGVAVIGAVGASADPEAAARALVTEIERGRR